jgi:predicted porin
MNSVLVRRAVANVSILTLAAGSALAYAQADSAVLYGSARIGFNSQKVGSGNEALQVTDNASRFGVRGSERLWTGVDAVYSYEFGFAADALGTTTGFGVRHGAVGLRSATFGTFAIGVGFRQPNGLAALLASDLDCFLRPRRCRPNGHRYEHAQFA